MRMRRHGLFAHVALAALLAIPSCSNPEGTSTARHVASAYFSLADYFTEEAARLQRADPEIIKTVSKNGDGEQKKVRVTDWRTEFGLFIDADINKPAWQGSYRVDSTDFSLTYTSTDPNLRTKEIRVEKSDAGTITHVRVTNAVHNMLYQTDELLEYYVDSLYRITKQQHVRIIGKSHYTVTGEWQ
ncbi:hypothetical protein [Parapedobacter sp. 2B3]|uniref:hypothetical protein n=1 Tax=Parapedobacter sp. 2B3 TaxID=3342381 RepID=UPI0035B68E8F